MDFMCKKEAISILKDQLDWLENKGIYKSGHNPRLSTPQQVAKAMQVAIEWLEANLNE